MTVSGTARRVLSACDSVSHYSDSYSYMYAHNVCCFVDVVYQSMPLDVLPLSSTCRLGETLDDNGVLQLGTLNRFGRV